jgi:hypothetical protein
MTILNLGRLGDNINLLPVAYANKGSTFVTSEKYSSIFEGTSYCQTKKYSGDPVELQHCINLCQGLPDLRVAQVFMHPKETKQEKNYALESYRLGGFRDLWRKHPYVFDRRDPEREYQLLNQIFPKVYDIQPFIAVATNGVSSPFAHSKHLISGLQSRFTDYKIVDLSTIQAEKPFDLLGVLDAASCLVTIDTLHLWLANAAECPTIALINEGWRGSPPPVTATSTFRYRDYNVDQICDEVEKNLLPTGEVWAIVDRFGQEKRHRAAFKSQKAHFDHMLTAENIHRTANNIGDRRPLPMLKEMLAKALKFTKGRDIIVWTNDDVQIINLHKVVEHCRRFGAVGVRRDPAHIGRELFAFRWDWLADRIYNFPDCAVASPWFDLAVAAWIRRQFGWVSTMDNLIEDRYPAEIPNYEILFHEDHPSSWTNSMDRPASKWNERIFKMLLT